MHIEDCDHKCQWTRDGHFGGHLSRVNWTNPYLNLSKKLIKVMHILTAMR